jgi:hypothetical protein
MNHIKYEVRRPDGRLIGTLQYDDTHNFRTLQIAMMPRLRFPKDTDAELTIPPPRVQSLHLERHDLTFLGNNIPTLVLVGGKQSWLKHMGAFRRA